MKQSKAERARRALVRKYGSVSAAARAYGCHPNNIHATLSGRKTSAPIVAWIGRQTGVGL